MFVPISTSETSNEQNTRTSPHDNSTSGNVVPPTGGNNNYRRSPEMPRFTKSPDQGKGSGPYRKSPEQGGPYRKSPPQYRRSPPLQRTQITARHPVTQQVIRVANSKIVRTIGSDSIGPNLIPIYLCQDYMSSSTCTAGANCTFLHAHGSSASGWNHIPLENRINLDGKTTHDAGWSVQSYDNTLTNFLDIPSQYIIQTQGSITYAMQFNDHGPNGKFRFQICKNYSSGSCDAGGKCPYIHAHPTFTATSSATIHVNYVLDDISSSRYEMLPPGLVIRVFDPNVRQQYKDVPSEFIVRTQGSESYMANPHPKIRLQHCAHFYLKKICNRGPLCNFIHVADVDPDAPPGLPEDMPSMVGDYSDSPEQRNSPGIDEMNESSSGGIPNQPPQESSTTEKVAAAPPRYTSSPDKLVYRNDPYSTESARVVMHVSDDTPQSKSVDS
eukprot:PhF_6_TR5523/c0_g3_i1/m.7842